MCNINEIMDMLDWNNPPEVQARGRELAGEVKCLSIFMQPGDEGYCKNVWENCALILREKSDKVLRPYLFDLIEWLQDLTWPGALIILERLKEFKDYKILAWALCHNVELAKGIDDLGWLCGMSELLEQENLVTYLDEDIKNYLIKCREEWLA